MSALAVGQTAPAFERRPVFGLSQRVPAAGGRSVALFFSRPLGCPLTVELLLRIERRLETFELREVQPLLLCRSSLAEARDRVARRHVLVPVLLDPDGELFTRYGVDSMPREHSRAGTFARVGEALGLLLRHGQGRHEGPLGQRFAAFLVGGDGLLLRCWRGGDPLELPDPLALLEGAP